MTQEQLTELLERMKAALQQAGPPPKNTLTVTARELAALRLTAAAGPVALTPPLWAVKLIVEG